MNIIRKSETPTAQKPESFTHYYLRDEYELMLIEQKPHSIQTWHHHEILIESMLIIDGELVALWKEDGEQKEDLVKAGDFIETGNFPHTFRNDTDETVRFVVCKIVPTGVNTREIRKNDKVIDE